MPRVNKPVRTQGRLLSYLRSKKRKLKTQLDKAYYTLPFDEILPVLSELKETMDSLRELESDELGSQERQRRAA